MGVVRGAGMLAMTWALQAGRIAGISTAAVARYAAVSRRGGLFALLLDLRVFLRSGNEWLTLCL